MGALDAGVRALSARRKMPWCRRLVEMYIQGVSTRKVTKIVEAFSGHSLSATTISNLTKRLTKSCGSSHSALQEPYPYLILDARYEKCPWTMG